MAQGASPLPRPTVGAVAVLSVVIGLATAPFAHGQGAGSANLRGTVSDPSGAAVPEAALTLTNQRTRAIRSATTDAQGHYVLAALVPGPYRLRVEATGFRRFESGEVHLSPGDTLSFDARLEMGGKTEEVTVTAGRELLRTDSGAREGLITSEQIQNLSIVSRSAMELLRILPGTVTPSGADLETSSFGGGPNNLFNTSVNGTRGTTISPVLDGSKIVDIGSMSGLMISMNADMVEEVKVQTSNYAAEYGTAGVQVTAATKGGSATFHGSAYDYWRNWRLAANDRSNTNHLVPRPESNYQYPGFNLSGPVLVPGTSFNNGRDKLFFFVGYEYQHQVTDPGTTLGVVPTAKQRQGDFSELLSGPGQNLGQPALVTIPAGFPGAGDFAPNNNLGPYVDPIGRGFLNMYPQPNFSDDENHYNYAFNTPEPLNRSQLVTRLDWNASQNTHAYLRLAFEKEKQEWARGIWGGWSLFELPEKVIGDNKSRSLSLDVTSVLSPNLTNELIFSASQLKLDNDWRDPSKMTLSAQGIEGYRGPFDTGTPYASVFFSSWGQGLGDFAAPGGMPIYAHNDSISVADNLTKVLHAHTLKAGLFIERAQKQQNFHSSDGGEFVLNSLGMGGGTGNDYGDLLVGRMALYFQSTAVPRGEFRFWNYEGYVQDAWKARRNLTLELGLRVAKMANNEELNGLGLLFEPSAYAFDQGAFIDGDPTRPNGVLLASRGEIPKGIVPDPGVTLMPRANFAWDARGNGSLTVHGGAGLFYTRANGNFQYYVLQSPPNLYNTTLDEGAVPGGLTIASLPTIDPYARLGAGYVQSQDPGSVHLPRTWTWSLGVAERLPWRQTLEIAYVGHRADHLPNTAPSNYIAPGKLEGSYGNADLSNPLHRAALDSIVAAALRNYPVYSDGSQWYQYEAVSTYHGLQATLTRQAGRHVQYFLNYTFSKVLGTTGPGDYALIDPLDPGNRSYGVLSQDRTHIFNASYTLVVPDPIGSGGNAVLKHLLNGWQVSGITSYASGAPFRVAFTGDLDSPQMNRAWWGTDGHVPTWSPGQAGGITPVFLGNPSLPNTKVGEKVLDLDKITFPAFGESGPFQSPYYFRAPSRWNWDVTLFKNFALGTHGKRVQLRTGFFNLFNQAAPRRDLGDIDLTLNTQCKVRVDGVPNGAGGTADGVCDPTQGFEFTDLTKRNFGKIVSKHGHRVIELALRFDF